MVDRQPIPGEATGQLPIAELRLRNRAFLDHHFANHPDVDTLRELAGRFAPSGQLEVVRILVHARIADALDSAVAMLSESELFAEQPDEIRGDTSVPENRREFETLYLTLELDAHPTWASF